MGLIGNLRGGQGSTGATGAMGAAGASGIPGPQWFTMTVDPTAADAGIGLDGDFWLNTTTGDLYKKVAGSWV